MRFFFSLLKLSLYKKINKNETFKNQTKLFYFSYIHLKDGIAMCSVKIKDVAVYLQKIKINIFYACLTNKTLKINHKLTYYNNVFYIFEKIIFLYQAVTSLQIVSNKYT